MIDPRRELPNYYRILGVASSATPQEIDQAYRRLASRHHPDASCNTTGSADEFKSISEAYQVLADPSRRRDYDGAQRRTTQSAGSPGSPSFDVRPGVVPPGGNVVPFGGVIGAFAELAEGLGWASGGHTLARHPAAFRTDLDVEAELPVTPEEAARGGPCEFLLSVPRTCPTCDGRPRAADVACGTCHGTGRVAGPRESIRVVVPWGVRDGASLRVPGRGRTVARSAAVGDLYLTIRIRPCW